MCRAHGLTVHIGDTVIIGGKGGVLVRRQADDEAFIPWVLGITQDIRDIEQQSDGPLGSREASARYTERRWQRDKIATDLLFLNALTDASEGDCRGRWGDYFEIGVEDEVRKHESRVYFFAT